MENLKTQLTTFFIAVAALASFILPNVYSVANGKAVNQNTEETATILSDAQNVQVNKEEIYFEDLEALQEFSAKNDSTPSLDLQKYFYEDIHGNIQINMTALKSSNTTLFLSEKDITDLSSLNKEVLTSQNRLRGFVGLYLKLGKKIRAMNANIAGAFAMGYCGFYLSKFAVTPVTFGVVGVISAGIAGAVKWAVKNKITTLSIGQNVPFISWSFTVNIP